MAGLIEKNATIPITIRISGEITDGQTSFENHPAMAMVFESSQTDSDNYGTVQNTKTFLVAPFDVTPEIPCEIIHNDACYTVKSIKTIRNMKSVLLGYKIVSVGSA